MGGKTSEWGGGLPPIPYKTAAVRNAQFTSVIRHDKTVALRRVRRCQAGVQSVGRSTVCGSLSLNNLTAAV